MTFTLIMVLRLGSNQKNLHTQFLAVLKYDCNRFQFLYILLQRSKSYSQLVGPTPESILPTFYAQL